jgi:hypothetical protein
MLQTETQLLEQPRLVKVDAHPAAILVDLLPQHVEEALVLALLDFEMPPRLDGIAGVHCAAGVEAVGAELVSEIDRRADLAHVEPSRREVDLDGNAGSAQVAQSRRRCDRNRRGRASG